MEVRRRDTRETEVPLTTRADMWSIVQNERRFPQLPAQQSDVFNGIEKGEVSPKKDSFGWTALICH